MQKVSALIVTAGLVMTALTACASPGVSQASCDSGATSGNASALVAAAGDFGSVPQVTFPTPLKTTSTQRTEIISGSGAQAVPGQQLNVELNVYNGTTGQVIQEGAYDGVNVIPVVLNGIGIKGLTDGLLCAKVGERVAIVVAPEDAFGAAGNEQFGVAPTDSLVVIADVVKAFLPRANGADQIVANGLPAVVLDQNGVPGIVIPNGDPPSTLEVGVLKKGDGEMVKEGATATVNYSGVLWKEKTVFDSSWVNGSPVPLVVAEGSENQAGVIAGMATALTGQTVGSQIVMVVPPNLGYGSAATAAIPADSTLVFVVDILGVS